MDLRWLSAPEREVVEAMARLRKDSRPSWVPTRRQVLVHVNHCLMLWYLCIVWMTLGVRIDTMQHNQFEPGDIRDIIVVSLIFVIWACGTLWLYRWASRPPSRRSQIAQARQTLTALANGFEPRPTHRARFTSLITLQDRGYYYPGFSALGVEFGNLVHKRRSSRDWQYLAIRLQVPLPHVILDSRRADAVAKRLPVHVHRHQRLSLEGDFDRWFSLYVPAGYERDALFVFTPDVMAALVDHASAYSIEVVDDTVVFFAPGVSDFASADAWMSIAALLEQTVPRLVTSGSRYRDERVPEQTGSRTIASVRAALAEPGGSYVEPRPRIGPTGNRLNLSDRRTGGWWVAGAIGWIATLAFLYVVPGLFAFAGIMSIIDGR